MNHPNFTTFTSAKKVVKNQVGAIVSSTTGSLIKILLTARRPDCGGCCTKKGMECFASFAECMIVKIHSIAKKSQPGSSCDVQKERTGWKRRAQ